MFITGVCQNNSVKMKWFGQRRSASATRSGDFKEPQLIKIGPLTSGSDVATEESDNKEQKHYEKASKVAAKSNKTEIDASSCKRDRKDDSLPGGGPPKKSQQEQQGRKINNNVDHIPSCQPEI